MTDTDEIYNYKPYKYGLKEMKYMPTICQHCQKMLAHTYVEKDSYQPEIIFYVLCMDCYNAK